MLSWPRSGPLLSAIFTPEFTLVTFTWTQLLIVALIVTLVVVFIGKLFSLLAKLLKVGLIVLVILVAYKLLADAHLF